MKKIPVDKIDDFFAALSARQTLYIPVDDAPAIADASNNVDAPCAEDGTPIGATTIAPDTPRSPDASPAKGAHFVPWFRGAKLTKAHNTTRSAKDFFFPQTENLFDMKICGKTVEVIDTRRETDDFILFGVRACDVQSFAVLDTVFLQNPVDTYYKNRREHATVISLSCSVPGKTCFCSSFGIDAVSPEGDIRSVKTNTSFYFEAITEKGATLLDSLTKEPLLQNVFTDASAADEQSVLAQNAKAKEAFSKNALTFPDTSLLFTEKNLNAFFDSPVWGGLSEACLACGTCTFVCPTCQCYDIREFDTGSAVRRFRTWDSCMYSDFTKMSAGQPRQTQLERFRQRFMHKLVYFPVNNNGMSGCVGCGRCLVKCPISMNIVKVATALCENFTENTLSPNEETAPDCAASSLVQPKPKKEMP